MKQSEINNSISTSKQSDKNKIIEIVDLDPVSSQMADDNQETDNNNQVFDYEQQ